MGGQMKHGWQSDDKCKSLMMGTWGSIILVSLLLYMFK